MTRAAALRIEAHRLTSQIARKRCSRCGRLADEEAFFRQNRTKSDVGHVYVAKHSVCIGCELTARNEPTPEARALRKAHNSISHHARKYHMPAPEFARLYAWKPDRMAHDVLHASENTCGYCWTAYRDMGHGLSDLTFDIRDRDKQPYYHINVQICCATCNQEKATLPPEIWARRLIEWREYKDWADRLNGDPTYGLPLFGNTLL